MNSSSSSTSNDAALNENSNSVEFVEVKMNGVPELLENDPDVAEVVEDEATTTNEDATGDNLEADIDAFIAEHSTCSKKCTEKFTKSEIIRFINESREMDQTMNGCNRLNTMLLAIIRVIHSQKYVEKRSRNTNRSRAHVSYQMHGTPVCHKFFLKVHAIGDSRWSSLLATYKSEGLVEKKHGNCERKPRHSLQSTDVDYIETFIRNYETFIRNYATQNALLTADQTTQKNKLGKLLPRGLRKSTVYKEYVKTCTDSKPVSVTSFKRIWMSRCRDIILQDT